MTKAIELSKQACSIIYTIILIIAVIGLLMVFLSTTNAWVNAGGIITGISFTAYVFMSYYKPLAQQMPNKKENEITGQYNLPGKLDNIIQ